MTIAYWAALALVASSGQDVPAAAEAGSATIRIARDTPVELMALSEVSTATAHPGTVIKLRVNKPVEIDGRGVIPVGTPAFGEVVSASDAGGLGRSGKMTARLVRIQFGEAAIPLDGDLSAKGRGSGSAVAAVVFVGLMGLFHRGNNAKIKAGEIVSAFVAEDVTLDLSTPVARTVTMADAKP